MSRPVRLRVESLERREQRSQEQQIGDQHDHDAGGQHDRLDESDVGADADRRQGQDQHPRDQERGVHEEHAPKERHTHLCRDGQPNLPPQRRRHDHNRAGGACGELPGQNAAKASPNAASRADDNQRRGLLGGDLRER